MSMYTIKVKDAHPWNTARVGGRDFSKHGTTLNAVDVTDEIKDSPLLDVAMVIEIVETAPVETPVKVDEITRPPKPEPAEDDAKGKNLKPPARKPGGK